MPLQRVCVCVCDVKISISVTSRLVLFVQTEVIRTSLQSLFHQNERPLSTAFVLMLSLSNMLPWPWLSCCVPLPDILAEHLRLHMWRVYCKAKSGTSENELRQNAWWWSWLVSECGRRVPCESGGVLTS
jgi:hypothetical protein